MRREDQLRAAFVGALPGLASSTGVASERAAQLNETFAQFVARSPPLEELKQSCEQYLEYATQQEIAGPCGLEAACRDFLGYYRELRPNAEAVGAAIEHSLPEAASEQATATQAGAERGPPVYIVLQDVQWHSASDVGGTVARLRTEAVTSLELRGAPVDAQDNDTISAEAASALAAGLVSCRSTLTMLALKDMKINTDGLRAVLGSLAGSSVLHQLDLSNMCSRWTVTNTLGGERGALLSELMRGWPRLESIILADCTLADGCVQVAAALSGLAALREVDLTYNEMGDAAAMILAKSLEGKAQLESVALDGNDIGPTGRAAIRATLEAAGKILVLR